jgi:lysophospholipase L1-like esterase
MVDYCAWSTDGTGDLTKLRPGMFADTIHPNAAGYAHFAEFAVARIKSTGKDASVALPPSTRPTR